MSTADLLDAYGDRAAVCETVFRQFGGVRSFARRDRDGAVPRGQRPRSEASAASRATGRVLVVDGGGSLRCALVGDNIAALALASGWAGLVINGCVRDSATLAGVALGVTALGTHPRASGKLGDGEVDVPVTFGAVTFRPGARIASDDDGVVVIDAP